MKSNQPTGLAVAGHMPVVLALTAILPAPYVVPVLPVHPAAPGAVKVTGAIPGLVTSAVVVAKGELGSHGTLIAVTGPGRVHQVAVAGPTLMFAVTGVVPVVSIRVFHSFVLRRRSCNVQDRGLSLLSSLIEEVKDEAIGTGPGDKGRCFFQAPADRMAGGQVRSIPAFQLRVSLNGRFWEEMERVLF